MVDFVPPEKGNTIRFPSTALLTIDSEDRNKTAYPSAFDFQIERSNNILAGFFTRFAITEVVMNYNVPNIYPTKNTLIFDISGDGGSPRTITLFPGNYTAYEVLENIVNNLNDLSGSTGATFNVYTRKSSSLINLGVFEWILKSNVAFSITGGSLYSPLNVFDDEGIKTTINGGSMPDLRNTRYIDIISTQLTYCQDLKDSSTSQLVRDSLCRFYLANETTQYDDGGLILYPGYLPVQMYRQFTFPKQIRWDNIQPIGNLTFQLYDSDGKLLVYPSPNSNYNNNWQMTLQVSEV